MAIPCHRLAREQKGQGMVEFAMILPVLLLIVVGIIEFGSVYSHVISMRQGVREAGRQGSVANFGNVTCGMTFTGGTPSLDMQKLLCLAQDQAGVGDVVHLRVKFADQNLQNPTEDGTTTYKPGNAIIICGVYPLQSLTGLFQPFLNGHNARTKAAFRIEKVVAGTPEMGGGEDDPTGGNWTWCDAQ
jgi:hypothetical protein